jgi:hypothetical protein
MMLGGESQRARLNQVTGYSMKAQCTGKPAYLEPNRDSMQKPIGGLSPQPLSELYKAPLNKGAIEKNRTSDNKSNLL